MQTAQLIKKDRIFALDELRGFAFLEIIIYHLLYDLKYMAGFPLAWFGTFGTDIWQQQGSLTFLILAGYCTHLSKNCLRRGAVIFGAGLLLSVVTCTVLPEFAIRFGVLHCIGLCMLLTPFLKRLLIKIPPLAGCLGCTALFFLTRTVPYYRYQVNLYPLGFPGASFASSDYFPLLPFLFPFLLGYFLGRFPVPSFLYISRFPALAFLGRHSLLFYLLHQPAIAGILLLLGVL